MKGRVWVPALGLVAWLCCLSLEPVQGGKVLVLPVDGSHWLSMKILVEELTLRGHDATVLVPETSLLIQGSQSYKTEVHKVPFTKEELDDKFKHLTDTVFDRPPALIDFFQDVQMLINFTLFQEQSCESVLTNKELMSKLKNEGFDMVLTDPFLPCGSILSHIFSIPAVYFMRELPCGLDLKANQCPTPRSYVPVDFSGNSDVMTFPQRVKNMMMHFVESYVCTLLYTHFDALVSRHLKDITTYKELVSHAAIWLLRYDFTFEYPKPIMPNMVFIGGINCAKTAPLPADLEDFVEGSGDDGFIVFTLGSMVSTMPEKTVSHFIEAFRQIPQRVLWRYTGAFSGDIPKNVKMMKWLPQNDLLAHPKAKVFITHGGSHGIYEGICHGVPMLMFPLFGDQPVNAQRMVTRGVAEILSIYDVTTESLVATLKKMISNKSYKEKMSTLSEVHRDRPVGPLDLGVFWSEFVMRHKGAEHLRVAAHDLNWIQYHSLDVFGFFLLILVVVLWLELKFCLFCIRKCCRKGTGKRKSE